MMHELIFLFLVSSKQHVILSPYILYTPWQFPACLSVQGYYFVLPFCPALTLAPKQLSLLDLVLSSGYMSLRTHCHRPGLFARDPHLVDARSGARRSKQRHSRDHTRNRWWRSQVWQPHELVWDPHLERRARSQLALEEAGLPLPPGESPCSLHISMSPCCVLSVHGPFVMSSVVYLAYKFRVCIDPYMQDNISVIIFKK
jgi:hypothetical protein